MTDAAPYEDVEIIAHRGDSWYAPENTMASVTSAWAKGADAVEVDVYLTKDGRVVALHDRTTGRTGDNDLHVNESTSEQLRLVDVGSWKGEAFAGEGIPFLGEIVASVPFGKRLFIEIKGTAETVPYIREIIEGSGKQDQIVVIGFELETVKESKAAMPDLPAYWLLSPPRDDQDSPLPLPMDVAATAEQNGLDGLNVNFRGISRELVDECRRLGLGIFVWTVNEVADLEAMAQLGVDGITTDRIDNAQATLR
ncbi:MAG: glycerophosphodiester phosphodiesterase [Longimicrobiales bacterium]